MKNFDLRKFLTENKLTDTSKRLDEAKVNPKCSKVRKWAYDPTIRTAKGSGAYATKKPENWNADDFKSWVEDNMTHSNEISDPMILDITGLPKNTDIIEFLNDGGSGLNNNKEFKKYGNWRSALYDIWDHIKNTCLRY